MAITSNIGGTNYTSTNTKTPYLEMYNQYAKQQQGIRDAFRSQMETDKANDINRANAQYDNAARQNYINYMQQRKNLPNDLNAANINGGAAESSLIRLGTNYGSNIASNEAARGNSLDELSQNYADRLAQYEEEYDNKLQSAYLTMLENQQKYEQEQREKDLQYFANSITGRFSSVSQYENLIKQLRASSDPNKEYKIALAQQAMNALAMSQRSSGGGGGGGRSYGYGSGYGSGYGADTTSGSSGTMTPEELAGSVTRGAYSHRVANAARNVASGGTAKNRTVMVNPAGLYATIPSRVYK